MTANKTLIFKKVPEGTPVPGEHLAVEDRPIDIDTPPKGGLVVKVLYASFDPYLRGRMAPANTKSYTPPFELGGPFVNNIVAEVVRSDVAAFRPGDLVVAFGPLAQYARLESADQVRKLENPHGLELPHFLGALGMPGRTAYSGLHAIGKPRAGETLFVSSAAGAVGQLVGVLAKHEGLRVIGSVGSDDKLDYIVKELGFDAGFNYKKERTLDALKRLAPEGVDIYFENVGGQTLEDVLEVMNDHGRIVACGMISQYNVPNDKRYGVKNLMQVVAKRLTFQGFIVGDPGYGDVYDDELQRRVQPWIADGSFKAKLSITDGIDHAPEGFVGMLQGKNFGKAVLKI
ncbi:hypothetical protein VTK73DRAFT_10340 [Phialemonium thermophilum]|uniref:Enoyl reductase (ER) domain-containing protein n=1 Tax=Phialemonium thermophilum TaxID=223376 RepID=A0ABR3VX78_9PEZI